jgi:hypothetical protein
MSLVDLDSPWLFFCNFFPKLVVYLKSCDPSSQVHAKGSNVNSPTLPLYDQIGELHLPLNVLHT